MIDPARQRAAILAMVVATLLWGGTFVAIRDSVDRLSPAALVFGRFAIASVVLWLLALVRRRLPDRHHLVVGAGSGVFMAGGYAFQAWGLQHTSAGSSAFLTCAGTLLAGLIAWPVLRQRPDRTMWVGLAIAVAGSALLSLDGGFRLGQGEAVTLLGAALFAVQIVWVARHADSIDPLALVTVQVTTVALLVAPFAGDLVVGYRGLPPEGWLAFAYLVLAGSTIAPLLQIDAQRVLPAARIGLLFALEPVFALVFALTMGSESFQPRWWAGAVLILIAVVWVEWRAAREPSPRSTPAAS